MSNSVHMQPFSASAFQRPVYQGKTLMSLSPPTKNIEWANYQNLSAPSQSLLLVRSSFFIFIISFRMISVWNGDAWAPVHGQTLQSLLLSWQIMRNACAFLQPRSNIESGTDFCEPWLVTQLDRICSVSRWIVAEHLPLKLADVKVSPAVSWLQL